MATPTLVHRCVDRLLQACRTRESLARRSDVLYFGSRNQSKPKTSRLAHGWTPALSLAIALVFGSAAQAATYFWDSDGATPGFGLANGTWGSSAFWSTDATGASATANTTISTADSVNFGTASLNYGGSTVTVAGSQGFLDMTFGAGQTTALTLSGGTRNLNTPTGSTITQNSASLMTITSVLAGASASLTKEGTGTLSLRGANTYTGATIVNDGILRLGVGGSINFQSAVSIASGAELELAGSVANQMGTNASPGGSFTIAGTLRNASNTSSQLRGDIIMNNGTITSTGTYAAGFGAFQVGAGISRLLTANGSSNLIGGSGVFSLGNNTAGATLTIHTPLVGDQLSVTTGIGYNAATSGTSSLTKTGLGTLTLSGASAYNGGTTISGGRLIASNAAALGVGGAKSLTSATLEINNVTLATSGGTFNFNNGAALVGTGAATLSGSNATIANAAAVNLSTTGSGDSLTLSSAVLGGNASSLVTVAGPGTVVLASGSTAAGAYAGSWKLTGGIFRLSDANALGNPSSGGTRPIELAAGTLQLRVSSDSTFSTATTVSGNSSITPDRGGAGVGNTHTLGALSMGAHTLTVNHGANYNANNTGSLVFGATTLTGSPTFTLNNVNGSGVGVTTLGALNDAGVARTINKGGLGTLTLASAATSLVNGTAVNITAGTLNSNHATALGALANVSVSSGAVFNVGASQTVGALNGASGGSVTLGTNTLTIGNTANNLNGSFSGVLSGVGGSLTKTGNGVAALYGANTYSGATAVNDGTLLINGSLTGAGGAVTVVSGGKLGGSGTISRAVNINAGGTLAPGNSPDQIFTGALTFAPTSIYEIEIFGPAVGDGVSGYDQTVVTGAVTLNNAILSLITVTGVNISNTFTIIDNDGTDLVSGTFFGLAEGDSFSAGYGIFTITYQGGVNNNDVVLTLTALVPEPGTFLLAALGAVGLLGYVRRHRNRSR